MFTNLALNYFDDLPDLIVRPLQNSWMDAPDDVFFKAGKMTRDKRKLLTRLTIRRAARKPFAKVLSMLI